MILFSLRYFHVLCYPPVYDVIIQRVWLLCYKVITYILGSSTTLVLQSINTQLRTVHIFRLRRKYEQFSTCQSKCSWLYCCINKTL